MSIKPVLTPAASRILYGFERWRIACTLGLFCILSLGARATRAEGANAPVASGLSPVAPRRQPLDALGWGPLALRSRAPIFDNRLSFTPGRIKTLGRMRSEVQINWSHVNIWAQMPSYFFDGEFSRIDVRYAYGLGHRTEVSLDVGGIHRSGGYLDAFIEGFHSAFGITQARRLNYPNDRLRVETTTPNNAAVWLDDRDAGAGWTNPIIAIKYGLLAPEAGPRFAVEGGQLLRLNVPTVSVDFAVKLPLGSLARQFASRRVTLLADVALEQPIVSWMHLFVTYGLMLSPGIAPFYGMPMSEVQKFISLALVFRVARACTVVIQYLNQDGGIENADYTPMERTTHEFGLGAKWSPWQSDAWVLEAGLIENTVHDANTPDFGFTLGARAQL